MEVFYYPRLKSLVYFGAASSAEHWDAHWKDLPKMRHNAFVLKYTRKYVPLSAQILEAGCGNGEKVLTLQKAGYQVTGIDWAKATVERINHSYPDLKIYQGDIRALPFPDISFDCYWSLGVIEHFAEGFEAPLKEASRVVRPGGVALVTVPSMSWLRRRKAARQNYPTIASLVRTDFFQYVYDPQVVIDGFKRHGFELVTSEGLDGVKGFKDEVSSLQWLLRLIYQSNSLPVKVLRRILQLVLSPFAGHIRLYVFRRLP